MSFMVVGKRRILVIGAGSLAIVVVLVLAMTAFNPLRHAKAEIVVNSAILYAHRLDATDPSLSFVTIANLSSINMTAYPTIQAALNSADKNYNTDVARCAALNTANCMTVSRFIPIGPVSMPLSPAEATLALSNLPYKTAVDPNGSPWVGHGIRIQYNGNYYALDIETE